MSKNEYQPTTYPEINYRRGGRLIASYAEKRVRQYDTHDPRLVIDLIVEGKQTGKIIVDKFSPFEANTFTDIDRVEIIRGHHRARLLFSFGKTDNFEGTLRYEVYTPHGIVGYAYGENLDYLLASALYDDPKLKVLAQEGQGSFDKEVLEYLEEELGIPGIFK